MKEIEVSNIIAFLRSKGWTLEQTTDTHYLMKPPAELKPHPKARFHLVRERFKGVPDYLENMRQITRSISKLYDLDYYMLEELFSKSVQEIKAYEIVSAALLENAA